MKNSHCFFENRDCKYFPCHKGLKECNCMFCYCPLYGMKNCPGNPQYKEKNGKTVKVCTDCIFPHQPEHYEKIMALLKEKEC